MRTVKLLWPGILIIVVVSCGGQQIPPIKKPTETIDQFLQRVEHTNCIQITGHEEGNPPSCERIYYYHKMALDKLQSLLGAAVYTLHMDNVQYIRRKPIRSYNYPGDNLITFLMPAIRLDALSGFSGYPRPVYATMSLLHLTEQRPYRWVYLLEYYGEENIFCEEMHRIANELGQQWWDQVGHYEEAVDMTHTDPLKFNCHDWSMTEYTKNHPTN